MDHRSPAVQREVVVLGLVDGWVADYNTVDPHSALPVRSPDVGGTPASSKTNGKDASAP